MLFHLASALTYAMLVTFREPKKVGALLDGKELQHDCCQQSNVLSETKPLHGSPARQKILQIINDLKNLCIAKVSYHSSDNVTASDFDYELDYFVSHVKGFPYQDQQKLISEKNTHTE